VAFGGPFVVGIAEQRRTPGRVRPVAVAGALPGLALSDAEVPDDALVAAELDLELLVDGHLTARGTIRAPWTGRCRRCLQDVAGAIEVEVSEVFEPHPAEDAETYPLDADRVDLEPMVRDAVLLALPLAPLCRDDCAGPDPDTHPVGVEGESAPAADPRWAALGELRFDS
jgi:uncharacterized protein